jgi:hypothetical protein
MRQIDFNAVRGLIAVLRGLVEELQHDRRDGLRERTDMLARVWRFSRQVAMDPLHGIRRLEGERSSQHLVQAHAERIQIAPAVDAAVRASRLFGSHVCERSR